MCKYIPLQIVFVWWFFSQIIDYGDKNQSISEGFSNRQSIVCDSCFISTFHPGHTIYRRVLPVYLNPAVRTPCSLCSEATLIPSLRGHLEVNEFGLSLSSISTKHNSYLYKILYQVLFNQDKRLFKLLCTIPLTVFFAELLVLSVCISHRFYSSIHVRKTCFVINLDVHQIIERLGPQRDFWTQSRHFRTRQSMFVKHVPPLLAYFIETTKLWDKHFKSLNFCKICRTRIISPHAHLNLWLNNPAKFHLNPCINVGGVEKTS